jgi:hypothetical protein
MYEFELVFKLPFKLDDTDDITDRLFEAGCDDATISFNKMGLISLSFDREADSAKKAVESAIDNVQQALPDAVLIEASPDYVTLFEKEQSMEEEIVKNMEKKEVYCYTCLNGEELCADTETELIDKVKKHKSSKKQSSFKNLFKQLETEDHEREVFRKKR